MAIGISSACGVEVCKLDKVTCAGLVSVFAIFNGLGRPLFGWLTDKITPRKAAVLSFIIIGLASVAILTAGEGTKAVYVASFCGFWLCLGGWLAIGPTATAGFFGLKNIPLSTGSSSALTVWELSSGGILPVAQKINSAVTPSPSNRR